METMTSKERGTPYGGLQMKAELRPKLHDGAVVPGEVEDHGDGTYTITFTPQIAGLHQLLITMEANGSNTIKVFTPEGTCVRSYGDVKGPSGIVIDEKGYSFVNEKDGNCLSIFDPQGSKVHSVGNLNGPRGAILDPKSGSLYVANCGAGTVYELQ
eukprot:Em0004g1405a